MQREQCTHVSHCDSVSARRPYVTRRMRRTDSVLGRRGCSKCWPRHSPHPSVPAAYAWLGPARTAAADGRPPFFLPKGVSNPTKTMQILRALWILANNGKRSRMAPVSAGCLFLHLAGIVVVLMGLLPRQLFTCGNMYRVGAPSLYITVYVIVVTCICDRGGVACGRSHCQARQGVFG